jgi:hypothetical protein
VTEKHFDESKSRTDFQKFLLNSPEMSDEELQRIEEKREYLNQ